MSTIEAIDMFCGVGGLTYGLKQSGIHVLAGLDNDPTCSFSYEENNKVKFIKSDICDYDFGQMSDIYSKNGVKILVGCAPCQPFSSLTRGIKEKCEKWGLLDYFSDAVEILRPEIVSVENVVGIIETDIFKTFVKKLKELGYFVNFGIVNCANYGIPQTRKRMILLASVYSEIPMPQATHSPQDYITVREAIGKLPPIKAGQQYDEDIMHKTRNLSKLNLKRIRCSRPGGTWREWDKSLLPACYTRESGKGFGAVYGRMEWDKPSPTITTQFSTYGCGRFGHPEQDRALSVREAAILQTFPPDYIFQSDIDMRTLNCHIGNAVPPELGKIIGETIQQHISVIMRTKK